MNDPAMECVGVGVERGGVRVVSDVDLTVRAGDWVAVVGPNGAGKTSLMHATGRAASRPPASCGWAASTPRTRRVVGWPGWWR